MFHEHSAAMLDQRRHETSRRIQDVSRTMRDDDNVVVRVTVIGGTTIEGDWIDQVGNTATIYNTIRGAVISQENVALEDIIAITLQQSVADSQLLARNMRDFEIDEGIVAAVAGTRDKDDLARLLKGAGADILRHETRSMLRMDDNMGDVRDRQAIILKALLPVIASLRSRFKNEDVSVNLLESRKEMMNRVLTSGIRLAPTWVELLTKSRDALRDIIRTAVDQDGSSELITDDLRATIEGIYFVELIRLEMQIRTVPYMPMRAFQYELDGEIKRQLDIDMRR